MKRLPRLLRGRRALLFLLAVASPLCGSDADAAQFTLLRIENFSQAVGGSYHFLDNSTGGGNGQSISSSMHEFTENYNIGGDFSLLNPRLIKGSASLDLNLDQLRQTDQTGTASTSQINLGYRVSSTLLDRTPFPVSINADSRLQTVSPPYTRSYDVQSDDLSVALNYRNTHLPARLTMVRNSSETSGLTNDRRQITNSYSANINHDAGTFSKTSVNLFQTESESTLLASGEITNAAEVGANITNALNWRNTRDLARTLNTSYGYDQTTGLFNETRHNLTSTLRWELGKALIGTAGYAYASNRTDLQSYQSQSGNLNLNHRLFESLTTSVSGAGGSSTFNDGSEKNYGGGFDVAYRKKLPANCLFTSSYSFFYSVTDRQRLNATANAPPETYPISVPGPTRIALAHPSFLASTLIVKGVLLQNGAVIASKTYVSGIDYTVIPQGIEIPQNSSIVSDGWKDVMITYAYTQDPRITFASVSHGVSARLNLFNKEQFVYANYRSTDQQQIRGEATGVTLASMSHLDLGYEANIDRHSFHAEYGWNNTYAVKESYLDTRWLYQRPFASGNATLAANDHFSWYDQSTGTTGNGWENTFGVNGAYAWRPSEAIGARLGAGYVNTESDLSPILNLFSASLNLDGRFGKTTVTLSSSVVFMVSSESTSRSETVGISFRRIF